MKKATSRSRDAAEGLAIAAFSFIAGDPDRLGPFLAATGLEPAQIRKSAAEPHFLAGVLEHMLADESLLMAFADSVGIDPAEVGRARQALGRTWERDLP